MKCAVDVWQPSDWLFGLIYRSYWSWILLIVLYCSRYIFKWVTHDNTTTESTCWLQQNRWFKKNNIELRIWKDLVSESLCDLQSIDKWGDIWQGNDIWPFFALFDLVFYQYTIKFKFWNSIFQSSSDDIFFQKKKRIYYSYNFRVAQFVWPTSINVVHPPPYQNVWLTMWLEDGSSYRWFITQ